MHPITLGTKNPHKQEKLAEMVTGFFVPFADAALPDVEEHGDDFLEIVRNKAMEYSKLRGGYAIATDGGAVFPALSKEEWNPLCTKRFAATDEERIAKLLGLLADKSDRTVEWHEAIAVAKDGEVLFAFVTRALDGVIDHAFDRAKYKEGIWLCSITSFPQFGGRNYFDLSDSERAQTEDSWEKLRAAFSEWARGQMVDG